MRTQRETDLEDEIELLRGQLLSSYARVDALEAALERIQIDSDEIIIVAAQTISKYASQALANSEGRE